MSASSISSVSSGSVVKQAGAGAIAGLGGGVVFGMLMGMMGMLPMVGMLVGQDSAVAGFVVHMLISAFIGATYGLVAGRLITGWIPAVVSGMVNGVVWWVLGALVLMPIGLGMSQMVLAIGATQWMSLMGHLIYGVVTGLLFIPVYKRL
jgi:uncharacterized membrane protein YagU involved in acid resistance